MSRNYDRRSVEVLVATVWDEVAAFGIQQDNVPDPGMPKSAKNPAHSNTLYAMLADIREAWKRTDIPQVERQALLLHYGLGWTQKDIAFNQEVNQSTALRRIERGVGRLTAWLNGDAYHDDYDAPADADVHV